MQSSINDAKVLGFLGRALSLELSAVQLYSTQARLVANWGLDNASNRFREESYEEMQHAERIIARMIALGVAPNASQLRPVKLGPDLLSLLQIDHEFEQDLIGLYQDAVSHCKAIGSHNDVMFFQALLDEELAHADELDKWMAMFKATPPETSRRRYRDRFQR